MKKKTKRIKLTPLPKLIKETDNIISKYVRMRDKRCVTPSEKCNNILQCSHLISRGKKAVRFDLKNCNCQCSYHNYLHRYEPQIYTRWWLNKYGEEAYNSLVERSLKLKKYKREELHAIQIATKYLIEEQTDYKEGIESIQRDIIEVGIKEHHKQKEK